MGREQRDAMSEAPARRTRPESGTGAGSDAIRRQGGRGGDRAGGGGGGGGGLLGGLHRRMGNAVVQAALSGDTVGPMGNLVAGAVTMNAAGMGGAREAQGNAEQAQTVASAGRAPQGGGRSGGSRASAGMNGLQGVLGGRSADPAAAAFQAGAQALGGAQSLFGSAGSDRQGGRDDAQQASRPGSGPQGGDRSRRGGDRSRKGGDRQGGGQQGGGAGGLLGKIPGLGDVLKAAGPGGGTGLPVEKIAKSIGQEVLQQPDVQEAMGDVRDVLKAGQQVAQMAGMSPKQLLGLVEQASGGDLSPEVAQQLMSALGKAVKAADPDALKGLDKKLGSEVMGLAADLLPGLGGLGGGRSAGGDRRSDDRRSGDRGARDAQRPPSGSSPSRGQAGGGRDSSGRGGGGRGDGSQRRPAGGGRRSGSSRISDAPLRVARSAFRDRLTPSAAMGGAGVQEIQGISGGSFDTSRPLRSILDARHGAIADRNFMPVIDAMASAMSTADAFGYDPTRIIDAGAGKLTEQIDGAPERNRTDTAVKVARAGTNISLPYKQQLMRDLQHLLDDESGMGSWALNGLNVFVSDASCRSLNAEAYAIGNMIVFKDSAPAYEVVKEEVIHVLQQGGHLQSLQSIPSSVGMTAPTDAVEVEARGLAGTGVAPDAVTSSGIQVARSISIGETQGEVFQAVVQGAIPDGYSQIMSTWTGEGSAIQAGEDAVKQVINSSVAFPLDKVDALFSGDQFGLLQPNAFQTSLKHSNDNIVQEVVDLVMGICDKALSVLDGIIGVVTEIMNVVESFVQLLESISNAMQVFGAILIGIGTGLCFVVIPAGIGSQFIQWGSDLLNIGQKAKNLADQVKQIIEPLKQAIDKIEQVKEKIEDIREICGTIQECLDVYEWFMSDTSNERLLSSENLLESGGRVSELMGQLGGGRYNDYATKFWENSRPVIDYVLEGETEIGPVDEQSTPAPLGFAVPGVGPSSPEGSGDPSGVQEAFAQKKGERTGEGNSVYKDIVDPISWPSFFKPKPGDGVKIVTKFIGGGSSGDAGMPGAPQHNHPGETQGGGPGSGQSIVSGAMGVVGTLAQTPLNTESLVTDAVEFTQHALELGGYPSNIAETFDYLNNVIQYQEVSASLETQGSQRMQEARVLQENAQNTITAATNLIGISDDQEAAAQYNEEQGHEGVSFTDYLMNLSQTLQGQLQEKMARMQEGMSLSDMAGQEAMQSEANAESGMQKGNQLAATGGGIAAMLAQALIQVIMQQAMQQILSGSLLKNLIPGDLGKVMELGTTFLDTAQGSFDRAVQKEQESAQAQATYNQAIATDQAMQQLAQQTRGQAQEMKATAEQTLANAQSSESQGDALRERARELDRTLKSEQANAESASQQRLSEAGPMRPRTSPEYVDPASSFDGVSVDNPTSQAPGGTVTNVGPLPVSSDMGHPDPVAGAVPTELISATPLPFVTTNLFQAALDAYRQFGNPNVVVPGPKAPTMGAPTGEILAGADASQDTREAVVPSQVGGNGPSAYDPGYQAALPAEATNAEVVTERALDPDVTQVLSGIEQRSVDPQPPHTPEAQRAQLAQPLSDGLVAQEASRLQQVSEAQGLVPTAEHIYHTVPPLPSMLPPQPEFQNLVPMDTSALGYNAQQILIDGDIAAIHSWIGTLPTTVELLGEGVSDNLTMPEIPRPEVESVAALPVPQLEALQLAPVPELAAPQFPAHDVLRDNPERFQLHADVDHPSQLLRIAYGEVLDRVIARADVHEEQEQQVIADAQSQTVDAQTTQQQAMDAALTKRHDVMLEIRSWMEQSQNEAARTLETEAQARQDQHFDAMQAALDTGRGDADSILREGEQTARDLETQATAEAQAINSQSMAKATTLWGWFRTEASVFTGNIATMLGQLWNSANQSVELTLVGAHTDAMATLYIASDTATRELAVLDTALPSLYSESRQRLGDLGQQGQERLRAALDEAVQEMGTAAHQAALTVQVITEQTKAQLAEMRGVTREAIDAEWATFDEMAETLRAAKQVPPVRIEPSQPGRDVQEPTPQHPDEQRDFGEDAGAEPSIQVRSETVGGDRQQVPGARTPQPLPQATDLATQYDTFKAAAPTQKADNWTSLAPQASTAHRSEESTFQGSVDPLEGHLAGADADSAQAVGAPGGRLDVGSEGAEPTIQIAPTPRASTDPVAQAPQITAWNDPSPEMDAVPNAEQVSERFNEIPTHDPSIVTSPGPAPVVPATGSADPARFNHLIGQGLGTAEQATLDAQQAVLDSPAPESILRTRQHEHIGAVQPLASPNDFATQEQVEGMAKYAELDLPGEVQAQFDSNHASDMEASLEAPRADLDAAIRDRDNARRRHIAGAHIRAHERSVELQEQQQYVVDEQRQAIHTKRRETMDAQAEAMRGFNERARREHARQFHAVQDRINTTQGRVNQRFVDAQREAERAVIAAEQEAAREKEAAEQEANDRKWWEFARDWIADRLRGLSDAINSIFQSVREAVVGILDAAKEFAQAVIQETLSFVRTAISLYARFLQAEIDLLLGTFFPELAQELTDFVDEAVQVANALLDEVETILVDFIEGLVEELTEGLDAVLLALEGLVDLTLGTTYGILTGDWMLAIKMAFDAILQLLGIEPDDFYALVSQAEGVLQYIIDNPGAFASDAIDAGVQGFGQFAGNFLTHLENGFIQWATQKALNFGLQLASSRFDAMGLFSAAAEEGAITVDYLEARTQQLAGEENVARFADAWQEVEGRVSGGIAGLYDVVSDRIQPIYTSVRDAITEWLVQEIAERAVIKFASLFIPGGALLQAVMTGWEVFQWFREKASDLYDLVEAVLGNAQAIALGNIAAAANGIESALAASIPTAIDFLTAALGLRSPDDQPEQKTQEAVDPVREAVDDYISNLVDAYDAEAYLGMFDSQSGDSVIEFIDEQGDDHALWMEADGSTMLASHQGTYDEHLAGEDHDFYYLSEGDRGQLRNWGVLSEEGVVAGRDGDWRAVMDAADALNQAASQLPGMELPATPHVDEKDAEAEGKKDDGSATQGQAPGNSQQDADAATAEGGTTQATADAVAIEGIDPASLPTELPEFDVVGETIGWFEEISKLEFFHDDLGAGVNAVAPKLPDMSDRWALLGEALGGGALQGLKEGAFSIATDTAINMLSSKVPYLAGFIEVFQFAMDPMEYGKSVLSGITGGGKFGSAFNRFKTGDPIEIFTGVLDLFDGVASIVSTLSKVCWLVAGVGFLASLFWPVLLPFVALAAKWAVAFGTIATLIGLCTTAIRMVVIALQSAKLLWSDSDPEELLATQQTIRDQTSTFVKNWVERKGDKVRDNLQTRRQQNNTGEPAQTPGTRTPEAKPNKLVEALKFASPIDTGAIGKKAGESLEVKNLAKTTWDLRSDVLYRPRDGQTLMKLEAAGIPVFAGNTHREWFDRVQQKHGRNDTQDYQRAHQEYDAARARFDVAENEAYVQAQNVRKAQAAYNSARKATDAARGTPAALTAADGEVKAARDLVAEFDPAPAQNRARTADDMARQLRYESDLAPGDANKRLSAQDARAYADACQQEADLIASQQREAQQMLTVAETHRNNVAEAQSLKVAEREEVEQGKGLELQTAQGQKDSVFSHMNVVDQEVSESNGQVARFAAGELTYQERIDQLEANPSYTNYTGGPDSISGQNLGAGATGSLTSLITDAAKTVPGLLKQRELDAEMQQNRYIESLQGLADTLGNATAKPLAAEVAGFASEPKEKLLPGDGGWPDYEQQVKDVYERTSLDLQNNVAPMDVPSEIDAASHGLRMLMEEHQQLDADKLRMEQTIGMTKETEAQLQAATQLGEAQEKGIDSYVTVSETKQANQVKLEKASSEVQSGGSSQSQEGGRFGGHAMEMVTGGIYRMFSIMDGIGRLAGRASGGDQKMKTLENLGSEVPQLGSVAEQFGAFGVTEAATWQTQTRTAKEQATADKAQVTSTKGEMDSTRTEAGNVLAELEKEQQKQLDYEQTLYGHRQTLAQKHSTATDEGASWVTSNREIREAGVDEIARLLTDVYDHRMQ